MHTCLGIRFSKSLFRLSVSSFATFIGSLKTKSTGYCMTFFFNFLNESRIIGFFGTVAGYFVTKKSNFLFPLNTICNNKNYNCATSLTSPPPLAKMDYSYYNERSYYSIVEDELVSAVRGIIHLIFQLYSKIPGHQVLTGYIVKSYQNDPFRILLECVLVIFAINYLLSKKYSVNKSDEVKLSEEASLTCILSTFIFLYHKYL